MTSTHQQTQPDWVVYDELAGPELVPALWAPEQLPLPEGGVRIPCDPNADVLVGDGQIRVNIPRFSLSHDTFQAADNVKYLMFSTARIELPAEGPAVFGVDLAVRTAGGDPADVRAGLASLNVVDLDDSGCVFDICATEERVFALHERMVFGAKPGYEFSHLVESPFQPVGGRSGRPRTCEITLDRGRSLAVWQVDGRPVYRVSGVRIPERIRVGFGIFTLVAITDGRSHSLRGQGLDATWRAFRYRI
jgi:hypothetical protein